MCVEITTFREKAREDLRRIKNVLDANKVKFFLMFGTCLGVVRNGDFIPYDSDVDLGVIEETPLAVKKKICEDLRRESFRVGFSEYKSSARIMAYGQILTGIIWLEKVGENFDLRRPPTGWVMVRVPAQIYSNFREAKLGNVAYLVPDPPEPYLERVYGSTWRIPHKVFRNGEWQKNSECKWRK